MATVESYRPGYAEFPARVSLRTSDSALEQCVLKLGDTPAKLAHEAQVLRAMAELGLPVPEILYGPEALEEEGKACLVMSAMPGRSLPWIALDSLKDANLTCELLIEGIERLHALTEPVKRHEIYPSLPHFTLSGELDTVVRQGGRWLELELIANLVERLEVTVPLLEAPLAFTNGDYNPLNFLYEGDALSGWIDFEYARFEDPHIGFSRFFLWAEDDFGWGTGKKAGLVERWLYRQGLSRREFAPRLALRCLRSLMEDPEGNPDRGEPAFYFKQIPALLSELT